MQNEFDIIKISVRDHVKVVAVHLFLFVAPLTEMSPNEALLCDKSCSFTSFPLFEVIGPLLFCKDFELVIYFPPKTRTLQRGQILKLKSY